ncbi:MAG TPA: hypothetical protein EYP17_04080 [Candidatus Latescibacteria bacterium]|nr:hypothetical protein [Candidatus Latescibacterota bacterium]
MAKKVLVFMLMVLLLSVVILCLVGRSRTNHRDEHQSTRLRMSIPKIKRVRVVAVEERVSRLTKGLKPVPREVVPNAEKAVRSHVANKTPAPKRSLRSNSGPKRLLPADFRLNSHMAEVGRKLIEENSPVPMVQASYGRIGFEAYLSKMRAMGGRLFLGNAKEQRILAEVILDWSSDGYPFLGLDEGGRDRLEGMALFRPREIYGEPLIKEILDYSRPLFKGSDLRCVILLPLEKEAAILGALKEYLSGGGYQISQLDMVWGSYFQRGSQFGLKVEKGRMGKTQEIISLDLILLMEGEG